MLSCEFFNRHFLLLSFLSFFVSDIPSKEGFGSSVIPFIAFSFSCSSLVLSSTIPPSSLSSLAGIPFPSELASNLGERYFIVIAYLLLTLFSPSLLFLYTLHLHSHLSLCQNQKLIYPILCRWISTALASSNGLSFRFTLGRWIYT